MGKVAQNNSKYVIKAEMNAAGVVEKPDIVGAIFGQTEGLLDDDMDLRELQDRGKVGRIQVNVEQEKGKSSAEISIPSSLNAADTAIIAASLETIERVGPSSASIKVKEIADQRVSKRDYIVKRAKQLLQDMHDERPESQNIEREVKSEVRKAQATEYRGFTAGPEAEDADRLIVVEGKADLEQLMKYGITNVLAVGGTSVPDNITEVVEDCETVAFVDGDRGGDLIIEELEQKIELDKIAKAPEGKEVEELPKKTVFEALRDTEDSEDVETDPEQKVSDEVKKSLEENLKELVGTRALVALDRDFKEKQRLPINKASEVEKCYAVVFDGEIDTEIIDNLEDSAEVLAGMDKTGRAASEKLILLTREEL